MDGDCQREGPLSDHEAKGEFRWRVGSRGDARAAGPWLQTASQREALKFGWNHLGLTKTVRRRGGKASSDFLCLRHDVCPTPAVMSNRWGRLRGPWARSCRWTRFCADKQVIPVACTHPCLGYKTRSLDGRGPPCHVNLFASWPGQYKGNVLSLPHCWVLTTRDAHHKRQAMSSLPPTPPEIGLLR